MKASAISISHKTYADERIKVYLPAIASLVPDDMVRAIAAFTEFCYITRRSVFTDETIK